MEVLMACAWHLCAVCNVFISSSKPYGGGKHGQSEFSGRHDVHYVRGYLVALTTGLTKCWMQYVLHGML